MIYWHIRISTSQTLTSPLEWSLRGCLWMATDSRSQLWVRSCGMRHSAWMADQLTHSIRKPAAQHNMAKHNVARSKNSLGSAVHDANNTCWHDVLYDACQCAANQGHTMKSGLVMTGESVLCGPITDLPRHIPPSACLCDSLGQTWQPMQLSTHLKRQS